MPVKNRRGVAAEEKLPARRGSRHDDDDEDETPRRGATRTIKKTGWAALAQKRQEIKEEQEEREGQIPEFYLTETNDTAQVQFLADEPVVVDGHQIKNNSGKWLFTPCQLEKQRSCLMCSSGIKITTKFAFKVIDFRSDYDKDKKRFKGNKPNEKIWFMGMKMAEQIKAFADKKGKELTEVVFEVSRSGSGKAVAYNYQLAFDKNENRVKPIEWEEKYDAIEKLIKPLKDEVLERIGFASNED